jgi:GcrA cell cycle regulator
MFSWTEEADATLKEMRRQKRTTASIAQALGVTRNAVVGRAMRLGLAKMRRTSVPPPEKNKLPKALKLPVFSSHPLPRARAMPVPPLNIPLLDLQDDFSQCREIVSADGQPVLFCGHPTKQDSSFCPFHHGINFTTILLPLRKYSSWAA